MKESAFSRGDAGPSTTDPVTTGVTSDDAFAYRPAEARAYVPSEPVSPSYPNPGYAPHFAGPGDYSKLNTYSVLSLVFAFIFAPVGIVFGALAMGLSRIPGAPRWMKTMGTFGFWLSIAHVVLPMLILIPLLLFGFMAARTAIAPFSGSQPMACYTSPITGETVCTGPRGTTSVRPIPERSS